MKLNVAVITLAAMFAAAAASPLMEGEKLAEAPHSAYADGKFVQGASGNPPPAHLMAQSPAASERIRVPENLAQSTTAYRERYQDPSKRAQDISNRLASMLLVHHSTPESLNSNIVRQTAELISEGNEQDPSAKSLSEHLNLIAAVVEQKRTLTPETRRGFGQAVDNYFKSHPIVREKYVDIIKRINAQRAVWPQEVTHAIRNLANQNHVLSEHNQMLNQRLHRTEGLLEGLISILSPEDHKALVSHVQEKQAHDREAFRLRQEEELRRANVNGAEKYPQGESHYATAPAHPVTKQTSAEAERIYGREPHAATKSSGVDAPHGAPAPTSESHHNSADAHEFDDEYDDEELYDDDYDNEDWEDWEDEPTELHNTPEHRGKAEESQAAGPAVNTHPAPSNEKAAPAPATETVHQ